MKRISRSCCFVSSTAFHSTDEAVVWPSSRAAVAIAWPRLVVVAALLAMLIPLAPTPVEAADYDFTMLDQCMDEKWTTVTVDVCDYGLRHLAGQRLNALEEAGGGNTEKFVDGFIWGTDLGLSVSVNDATVYFFGDT